MPHPLSPNAAALLCYITTVQAIGIGEFTTYGHRPAADELAACGLIKITDGADGGYRARIL